MVKERVEFLNGKAATSCDVNCTCKHSGN